MRNITMMMKNILLTLILGMANLTAGAAERPVQPPFAWWVVGPYACTSTADFEANEAIENAWNAKYGYNLEPWSPLKGKKLPCKLPVMGKNQTTME